MIKYILCFCVLAGSTHADSARYLSSYTWQSSDSEFGGFSSIHLDETGQKLLATSDRGSFIQGQIEREDEKIIKVNGPKLMDIHNVKGKPVKDLAIDAEGLAVRPDGRIYVSFERIHRVWTYSSVTSEAAWMPKHPDFKTLQNNSSLEALAIDAKGRLYAIPERSGEQNRPFPVYRYNGKKWDKRLSIPRRGPYLVTGADFGPDGLFYVLERDFQLPFGVSSRVRRFALTKNGFKNEEVLLQSSRNKHDNLEGISIWQDDQKRIRITLISDDNFSVFQKTEIVEYIMD